MEQLFQKTAWYFLTKLNIYLTETTDFVSWPFIFLISFEEVELTYFLMDSALYSKKIFTNTKFIKLFSYFS